MELNFDEIIETISKEANIDKQTILDQIKEKKEKLGGLVSDLGAAHLVARDYNIKLVKTIESGKSYKLNELKDGLRSISVIVKILQKNEPKDFQTARGNGRIASFFVMDETASARVVLWNDLVEKFFNNFSEGDIIEIKNANVKLRNNRIEIHLIGDSEITKSSQELNIKGYERKCIVELKDNELVEIGGTIIEINDPFIYDSCPFCKRKVIEQEDGFYCPVHNKVDPKLSIFLHFNIDDSTDMIRVNISNKKALDILNIDDLKLKEIKENPALFEELRNNLLGKYVVIKGRVVNNERLNKLELNLNSINLDPDLELESQKTRECIEKLNSKKENKEDLNSFDEVSSNGLNNEQKEKNLNIQEENNNYKDKNKDNSEISNIEEIDIDEIIESDDDNN